MTDLFPMMCDRPEKRTVAAGFTYWGFAFLVIPFIFCLYYGDLWGEINWGVGFELVYHGVNFLATVVIFRGYLKDAFLTVQISTRKVISLSLICALILTVYKIALFRGSGWSGLENVAKVAYGSLAMSEMDLFFYSGDLVTLKSVPGIVCLVALAPVSISCLYYGCGFAPLAEDTPWKGYLAVAVVLLIPRLLNVLTFWSLDEELLYYILQLPIHLVACWTYQKTDTIWTPIFVHLISNLLSCLFILGIMA